MNKSTPVLVVLVASLLAAAVVGTGGSLANKGGRPNADSENGASHANEHSAHGQEKQEQRGCAGIVERPTPPAEPTETPTHEPPVATTPPETLTLAPRDT